MRSGYVGQKWMLKRKVRVSVNSKFRRVWARYVFPSLTHVNSASSDYLTYQQSNTSATSCPPHSEPATGVNMPLSRSTVRALWRCPIQPRHQYTQNTALPQISSSPATITRQYSQDSSESRRLNAIREEWRIYKSHKLFPPVRRRFSATATAAHGHLTPPKPGEE